MEESVEEERRKSKRKESPYGKQYGFEVHIKEGAGAFVCGEETALMASIAGGRRGMPQSRPLRSMRS